MTMAHVPERVGDAGRVTTVAAVLRDVVRGAIAGGVAGVLVLGIGSRIVMRVASLLDPEAVGLLTENGNRIGDITLSGTVALALFGGLIPGLFGAVVWVAISPWIPGAGLRRAALAAPIAVSLSGFFLVEGDNPDFRILSADAVIIALLLATLAVFGLALALVDDLLDRRFPRPSGNPLVLIPYALVTVFGAVFIAPAAIGSYFSRSFCFCSEPPVPVGLALLVAGLATIAWWMLRARGASHPPSTLMVAGRLALLAAVTLGVGRVIAETSTILG